MLCKLFQLVYTQKLPLIFQLTGRVRKVFAKNLISQRPFTLRDLHLGWRPGVGVDDKSAAGVAIEDRRLFQLRVIIGSLDAGVENRPEINQESRF